MARSRTPFVELLKTSPSQKKTQHQLDSQTALTQKKPSHVFDNFDVLDQRTVAKMSAELKHIVENCRTTTVDEIDVADEKNIKNYLTQLATIACDDLLTKNGELQDSLTTELGWKKNPDLLITPIINSFLNAAHAQIVFQSPDLNQTKYPFVGVLLNQFLSSCVVDVLKKRGFYQLANEIEKNSMMMQLINAAIRNPVQTSYLAAGMTALFALGVFAFKAFTATQQAPEAKNVLNPPKPGHSPR